MFIDHITVAGPDLEEFRERLAAAGLASDYGGVHGNGITHMALAGFGDGSYLEIVAPLRADGQVSLWHNYQLPRAGGTAWTIASNDVERDLTAACRRGMGTTGPVMVRRERPDGKIGQWELGYLESTQPGGVLPFLIRDHTDRCLRVRPTATLEGMIQGWSAIVLAVHDVQAAAAQFQRVYEWDPPTQLDGLLHFTGTPIYLTSPADHLAQFGESPCACVLRASNKASVADLRYSSTSSLAGKTVRWLDLPWKHIRIGVEEIS
jgi:hypothetical protein